MSDKPDELNLSESEQARCCMSREVLICPKCQAENHFENDKCDFCGSDLDSRSRAEGQRTSSQASEVQAAAKLHSSASKIVSRDPPSGLRSKIVLVLIMATVALSGLALFLNYYPKHHSDSDFKPADAPQMSSPASETVMPNQQSTNLDASRARLNPCRPILQDNTELLAQRSMLLNLLVAVAESPDPQQEAKANLKTIIGARQTAEVLMTRFKNRTLPTGLPKGLRDSVQTYCGMKSRMAELDLKRAQAFNIFAETGDQGVLVSLMQSHTNAKRATDEEGKLDDAFVHMCQSR